MHNTVPEFDPARKEQTMAMWLHKVNECASIYGWTEKQLIHFSLPKLRGVAQRWYEGLSSVLFSWEDWQAKLLAAFPSKENYGQMLSDMVAKRARFGDSLEEYFYDKVALINKVTGPITGRLFVECILHGIDDRSVRLGAEAAQFDDPDKLLAYLRNTRNIKPVNSDRKVVRNGNVGKPHEVVAKQGRLRCFNCKQDGHVSSQCTLPIKKCTKCSKLGHEAEQCYSKLPPNTEKTVQCCVTDENRFGDKYLKVVEVDGVHFNAFIDFGSQCCMIKVSEFEKVSKQLLTDSLPLLRGFGNSIVQVLGRCRCNITIDKVEAEVDLYVVPDYAMDVPLMIGQSFTEQPHVVVYKTSEQLLMLEGVADDPDSHKIKLFCKNDVSVTGTATVEVYADPPFEGELYIEGGLRQITDVRFSVYSGLFSIGQCGVGQLVVSVPDGQNVKLGKGLLMARGRIAKEDCELLQPCAKQVSTVAEHLVTAIDAKDVKVGENVTRSEKEQIVALLNKYRECFAFNLSELGTTTVGEMTITLNDNEPVVYRPYRLAIHEKGVVRDMIGELLENGIIRPSTSPYASPIVLVRKKTGEYRLCIDFRALNKRTVKENYPIPLIDDQLDTLSGHEFYTTLDLASGYYQVPIRESDKHKTAFVTPDGHFEFNRMPFGLANAPATFQRIMNQVLGSTRHKEALAYLDDVIIPAKDFLEGMTRLENTLKLFSNAGLTLKLSKCLFFGHSVDYLGFEVSKDGIKPGSRKIEAVEGFPVPTSQHNVRQFLGLASFFRRFVPGFSIIAKPLTHLLKKDVSWSWGKEQQTAFTTLKQKLVEKPTLALYDPLAETELHTDACKLGLGAILLQRDANNKLKPVAFYSRQTTPEEQNYSSYDLETLAVISALRKFRVYLVGISFKVVTDCNSLRATFQKRDMIPRVARWWEQMQEFNLSIDYRPGTAMAHVDALSRNPIPGSPKTVCDILAVSESGSDWIVTVQGADSEIQRIINILKDPNLDNILDVKNNYKMKGDKLFRITSQGDRWVVPKGVRWQVVKQNHDDIGHFSVDKTLEKIMAVYWFPKMRSFVKKYVRSCLECTYAKAKGGKRPGFLHPIEKVDNPFDTVHVDHVGPFVRSKRGNIYVLVIVDAFTRYTYLKPVRSTKSHNSIRALSEYFGLFGVPRRLISDRGTSFTSASFKRFMHDKGIKHILNAVATPRANGQVERYNKVIVDALTAKSVGTPDNMWDEHLPDVQWGMNNTLNKGINRTPSEALFGIRPAGTSDSRLLSEIAGEVTNHTEDVRTEIRDGINSHVKAYQQYQKNRYDKKRCQPVRFEVGDLVRIERQVPASGQSKKLVPRFQGPYKITAILDHDRFQVEDTPLTRKNGRRFSTVVAIDKIAPWLTFDRPHAQDIATSSGNERKASQSFLEFSGEKRDLVKAQKDLLDLQIRLQQLEIRLTEEKLDFERKKNKIELDFLTQKYELELNYLKNKIQD
ncbi:hypothetical protein MSG28_011422 [Choristoneura fumiferana]|uniref:Uncharacterized protein n=1 Tax=Choristoneura fumiferana TaxID=7141 RepID=A0ACC0JNY9_CHOFU|nr:hypothetical protein MSG28_011422 [Choristoneura fumiferana]